MNILETKDPMPFLNPTLIKIGKCNFRSYQEGQQEPVKAVEAHLAPYMDNDGTHSFNYEKLLNWFYLTLDETVDCVEFQDNFDTLKVLKSGEFSLEFYVAQWVHLVRLECILIIFLQSLLFCIDRSKGTKKAWNWTWHQHKNNNST